MRFIELFEGRIYTIGLHKAVNNPSRSQAESMVNLAKREGYGLYFRGIIVKNSAFIWDGWDMTHDDVLSELFPDIPEHSSVISTFEIFNYTQTGVTTMEMHAPRIKVLKYGDSDPSSNRFVANIIAAMPSI